jgi:hypothetical protein
MFVTSESTLYNLTVDNPYFSAVRQKSAVVSPAGRGTKNDCAGMAGSNLLYRLTVVKQAKKETNINIRGIKRWSPLMVYVFCCSFIEDSFVLVVLPCLPLLLGPFLLCMFAEQREGENY